MGQPELKPFVFQDTGISVMIRKVSPLLVNELRKAFPEPKPPLQEVDYGDGNKVLEPNPAHPDHQKALEAYQVNMEQQMRKLLIKRGVDCQVDQDAVAELRQFWLDTYGVELEGDDKWIYVSYICMGTEEDMGELLDAILRRSQPTREDVELSKVSFRS